MDDRRTDDHKIDSAYALAILFTLGYFALLAALMFTPIPGQNKELMLTLAGILSGAMLGIIKHYYDGSKAAEQVQAANIARSVKSEAVIQDIATAAAPVAAAAVAAATGAPPPPAPAGSIKAENVNVETQSTVVTEKEKTP